MTLRSDRPLPGMRPLDDSASVAFVLRTGEHREVPKATPPGRLILNPSEQHRDFYTAVALEDGSYLLRFFAGCDVHVSADLSEAVQHRAPDADDGFIDVLLAGTFLAFLVALRGACVMHASAVELDGRALAFVGHSGMGKSTLAVASCAAGARLIAEDIVAVTTDATPRCLPGNTDIRLRKGSVSLLDRMEGAKRLITPDGREGVQPPLSGEDPVPLDTLVIPHPSRKATELTVEQMPPVAALFRLMNFPRLNGLIEPSVVRRQFQGTGEIARQVPVLIATVPWGPPFRADLGEQLLGLLATQGA